MVIEKLNEKYIEEACHARTIAIHCDSECKY